MSEAPRAKPPLGGQPDGSAGGRRPRVLLAHAGPVIAGAAKRILEAHGFEAQIAPDSRCVEQALEAGGWDALVVDVALPGAPGFELTAPARAAGVKVVILVASVFRRTSYKRQPQRLYGADDYVEIHHLGDHLPNRLRAHLGLGDSELPSETLREVLGTLREHGDQHLVAQTPKGLATLIVADLLLYNGDRITEADTVDEALAAVGRDLDGARELFEQVQARGELHPLTESSSRDLIDEAFRELVSALEQRSASQANHRGEEP
ncbi:MAG: hypothetical protein R6X02_13210 [Enhygromyxa sp.]